MELIRSYFPKMSETQLKQFSALPELYAEWNTQINVISRKDMDHFVVRHVLHSMALAKVRDIQDGHRILDVGTGGGFPGIPLAIAFPGTQFTLIDSIGKKIKVVKAVAEAIGLQNVNALHGRMEELSGKFDRIVSRAVAPALKIIRYTDDLLAGDGHYLFLKGGDLFEEEQEVKRYYPKASWEIYEIDQWFKDPFFASKKLIRSRGIV